MPFCHFSVKSVLVADILAWPMAYFCMNEWIQTFACKKVNGGRPPIVPWNI